MTQEKALEEFQSMFPDKADKLSVERERKIGFYFGHMNHFILWDHSEGCVIAASSNRSFEHALAIAKSGYEDIWEKDDSPIEEEASA